MTCIEPIGVTGEQVLHSPGKIGPGSAEEQMKVGHADEAENLKAEFVDDRLEPFKEPLVVSIVVKYLLPPIATGHGMVDGVWKLYA